MIYEKDHHKNSPYVSVNTLIKPRKKRDLTVLPSATVTPNFTISQPGDLAELEAHRVADQVVQGISISTPGDQSSEATIQSFERQAAEELKPLLKEAIIISQQEREKYFGREKRIGELVNLIQNNYGAMYLAADTLRARARIRFFKDEDVLHSSDMGLGQILWMPKHFDFNEQEIAENLKVTVKHKTNHFATYDPSVVKEMMAYRVFWNRIKAQNPEGIVEGTGHFQKPFLRCRRIPRFLSYTQKSGRICKVIRKQEKRGA